MGPARSELVRRALADVCVATAFSEDGCGMLTDEPRRL